jgi:putative copper resistance protein D
MAAAPDLPLAIVRAVHFAAAIVLFGQFAFALFVSPDARAASDFRRVAAWSLAAFLASAAAWLALEAISMSGLPPREALSAATLGTVVTQTQFGRVWSARVVVALVLIGFLKKPRLLIGGAASALMLVALAAMGHGGSGRGAGGWIHLAADGAHLLAAGAWLGALLPLVRALGEREASFAAAATRRFSTLGVASMAILLASGTVNACYMVATPGELVDSAYGRWLLAKLALFVAILAIAAINRQRLTPALVAATPGAASALRRNAIVECALGFAIVAIVGQLGITMPASHPMSGMQHMGSQSPAVHYVVGSGTAALARRRFPPSREDQQPSLRRMNDETSLPPWRAGARAAVGRGLVRRGVLHHQYELGRARRVARARRAPRPALRVDPAGPAAHGDARRRARRGAAPP